MGWNPLENTASVIIEDGFELLKKLGYQAKALDTQTVQVLSLDELKELVGKIEDKLSEDLFVELHNFQRNQRILTVALTKRLKISCNQGKVWKSKAFLTALKNAEYGFDETISRSSGGRDGIFLLDRDFKPYNEMMHKLFDQFIDKADSGINEIAQKLGVEAQILKPVRLVSHHLRLLGLLLQQEDRDFLVLVDYDKS